MNILFMNSARTWGGTEKWTKMASEAIEKNTSHKTFLVYRRDTVGLRFSVPKFKLPCRSHIDLITLFRLVGIVRRETIDIIIPTKRKDYMIAGLAGKITGIPVIARLGADRKLRWPWQRVMYSILPNALIVNAAKIKDTLFRSGWFRQEQIQVIYNGLDTAEIDRLVKNNTAEKPYPFTVGALGRVTRNKGFDYLIRSFALFLRDNPNADAGLIIVGEGADRKEFETLARKIGVEERVTFTGFIENPYPILQKCDIFAMTSTNEGLSNALLEAMYLGCPPVSTFAGGVREVIDEGKNGFLVNHGDEERLAGLIRLLYDNENKRLEIAESAKETVMARFSVPVMVERITAFCNDISTRTRSEHRR